MQIEYDMTGHSMYGYMTICSVSFDGIDIAVETDAYLVALLWEQCFSNTSFVVNLSPLKLLVGTVQAVCSLPEFLW